MAACGIGWCGAGFVGIDEWTHLHVLASRPGGVLIAFNMEERPVERTVVLKSADLGLGEGEPQVSGAQATRVGDTLQLSLSIAPRSPAVVEIGAAVAPPTSPGAGQGKSKSARHWVPQ